METISQIYQRYKIMPNLKDHQFRVAAVASIVCDKYTDLVHKENTLAACLLHDMGNIVKFNLERFPEFNQPEGIEYWQNVQNEYFEKYGKDEHEATKRIVAELNVNKEIADIVSDIEILGVEHLLSLPLEMQIRIYADFRVGPFGIIPLEERFIDGRNRYSDKVEIIEELERNEVNLFALEKELFKQIELKPEDINDESVKETIERLKEFVLK